MAEVELSQAELDAKLKEAADKAVADKQKELDDAKAELAKANDKDTNFSTLRKRVDELETAKSAAEQRVADLEKDKVEAPKKALLDDMAGADAELRAKIEAEFAVIGKEAKTPEDIEKAMKGAYAVATGKPFNTDVVRGRAISSAGGIVARPRSAGGGVVSPELSEAAAAFNKFGAGISEDDLKKAAGKQ